MFYRSTISVSFRTLVQSSSKEMKKYWPIALFALLTLVYFRNILFLPADALMTRHQGTDLYIYFLHASDYLKWLVHGFIPIGNYWVPHGGGFPATPLDQFITPSSLILLSSYAITHNLLIALRITEPLIYFLALLTSYWYGMTLFRKKSPAIILAIAYTFSMFGVTQMEHIDLLSSIALIPLALTFLEKTFNGNKAKYIILTSIAIFLVYVTHLYSTYFLLLYIALRVIYEVIKNPQRRKAVLKIAVIGGLFILMAMPFFVTQLTSIPSQTVQNDDVAGLLSYAQPPGLYFVRAVPNYFTSDNSTMYLGISIVILALLPILFQKTRKDYAFYLVATMLFIFYAIGRYGPINLAALAHNIAPIAFFVRVPGRALMVGYLLLATCAAVGFATLIERFKKHEILYLCIAVVVIFCDITIGYEPYAPATPLPNNGAYEWLSVQQGDFRIEEIPSISTQIAMTDIYTGHDTLSWLRWAYNYYEPLYAPANMFQAYVDETATAEQAAEYDIKYLIVNTDPEYYTTMKLPLEGVASQSGLYSLSQVESMKTWIEKSGDYKLVYDKDDYAIYENLQWKGFIYGDGIVEYNVVNPNTIKISINSDVPTIVNVAQSFDKGWKTNVGILSENESETQLTLPSGTYTVTLHYSNYEKSLLWFLLYIPLVLIIIWMLKRDKIHTVS